VDRTIGERNLYDNMGIRAEYIRLD
jgi:hypothetical protein